MDAAVRLLTVVLAALALAAPASGQVLGREPALRALKDPTAAERERGVVGLARNGQMADAPALVAALRDPDESVRAAAEQALWIVWSRSGNAQVDKLFAQGLEEMNGGRLDAGIATFTRVIETAPEFAEGWNKRATLYFLTGEYRKSLADCDEVMKRNPAHFGALAGYGQIYLRLDEPEKALEYFKRALVVNPNMGSVEMAVRLLEHSLAQRQEDDLAFLPLGPQRRRAGSRLPRGSRIARQLHFIVGCRALLSGTACRARLKAVLSCFGLLQVSRPLH